MKRLLLLSLLLGLIPSVKADSFCTLISESEPDVSLKMHKPSHHSRGVFRESRKRTLGSACAKRRVLAKCKKPQNIIKHDKYIQTIANIVKISQMPSNHHKPS